MAYSDLSNLFWKQSKFSKGIEYGLHSAAIFKQRGIKDMDYSFTLYVIGNNYLSVKDYPNAQQYFKLALAQSERYQFYNNLADIYIALNELYTITGDYAKAEVNAKQVIRYSTLLDNNFMLMQSWLCLAKLQNLTNRPDTAIASLKTCLQIAAENFGDEFFLNQAYKELGKCYAATGDYKNTYAAFLEYDTLKDSVFTAEADQRIAKLGYSHAVKIGDDIKISGAVSMDENGILTATGNLEQQMKNCYGDLEKILQHYGYTFDGVVAENVFTTNMQEFIKVFAYRNSIYKKQFPTGTWLEVKGLALQGQLIKIDMEAHKAK